MEKIVEIRNLLIEKFKETFEAIAVSEINGHNFTGADIAICDKNGDPEIYRIAVIKYEQRRENI